MKTRIKIENILIEDIKIIENIEKKNFNNNYQKDFLNKIISGSEYLKKKLTLEEKIIGYILVLETDVFEILKIFVMKENRNQGFGKLLLSFLNEKDVFIEVNKNNVEALDFYSKNGFERISLRKNYYASNQDAIIFLKKAKN